MSIYLTDASTIISTEGPVGLDDHDGLSTVDVDKNVQENDDQPERNVEDEIEVIPEEDIPEVFFPVFCINLPSSKRRKERMMTRFQRANFHPEHIHFVEAAGYKSGLVDYFIEGTESWNDDVDQWRKDIACFVSHLLAVRMFLTTEADYGFICEDDILFQNDFREYFQDIFEQLPEDCPLLSFTYMACGIFDISDCNSSVYCKFPGGKVWGAQFYMISREYAQKVLATFDRPLRELTRYGQLSSEIILTESQGYMLIVPLVIEDCIDSDRKSVDTPYHMKHFCYWGWENFSDSDLEKESPLVSVSPDKAWPAYGVLFPGQIQVSHLEGIELLAQIDEFKRLLN